METNYAYRRQVLDEMNSADAKRRQSLNNFRYMQPGAARRKALLDWMLDGRKAGEDRRLYVNRRHTINLRYDGDVQRMLKKGILVRMRQNAGPTRRSGSFHTYLTLAPGFCA